MDFSLNEDSLHEILDELDDLPGELSELKTAISEAKAALYDTTMGIFFNDYNSSIDECDASTEELVKNITFSLSLLEMSRSFESGDAHTIYDSYYGVQNDPVFSLFKSFFDGFLKKETKKAAEAVVDKNKPWVDAKNDKLKENSSMFSNLSNKKDSFENKINSWADSKGYYTEGYKYGKNQVLGTTDLMKFSFFSSSNEFYKKNGMLEGKAGTLSYNYRVGAYDAKSSATIGLDHINLEASASVDGASYSLAYKTPALKNRNGIEVLSAGASGEISVLHSEAVLKVGAGWDSKNNSFEAGLQMKAETDLFEAGVAGDVTVAGVDVGGSGSVKFGAGAELDCGWDDGKINFDVSLALGLGVEFGFSLDFSGLINQYSEQVEKTNLAFMLNDSQ